MIRVSDCLMQNKKDNRKSLVMYVTAGVREDWLSIVNACVIGGADVIELGIPYSDPMMDGPVIQQASDLSLARGTNLNLIFEQLQEAAFDIPIAFMGYYNSVLAYGNQKFANTAINNGVTAAIIPDLPFDDWDDFGSICKQAGVDNVLMIAPTTPQSRARMIAQAGSGFIYAVGRLGVTGVTKDVSPEVFEVISTARQATALPVIAGIGISTAEQAAYITGKVGNKNKSNYADGVIVGSALMRQVIEGASCDTIRAFVEELRESID